MIINHLHNIFLIMTEQRDSEKVSKWLRYCKMRKKYISRKHWSKFRFAQMLLRNKDYTRAELISYKLLSKRSLTLLTHREHKTHPQKPRGRPRLITHVQERQLVNKYKSQHRQGQPGTVRNMASDVCFLSFVINFFSELIIGFTISTAELTTNKPS